MIYPESGGGGVVFIVFLVFLVLGLRCSHHGGVHVV